MIDQPELTGRQIRQGLRHPIVDGDGHLVEITPILLDIVRDLAGSDTAARFARYLGQMFAEGWAGLPVRQPFWGSPGPTIDRMTTALPALMYEQLEELGIDFAVLYPGLGLPLMACADDELRQVGARALNDYLAELYLPYADRFTPTAVIPTFTPDEALDELSHAVGVLGFKAIVMTGVVPRSDRSDGAQGWLDTLGHDSAFDYDSVWARCQQLKVTPAFHGIGFGWGSRTSRTNYVYNHLGNFAAAQEAICRSLIMGGVTKRFPDLRFAFLEGGATWAAQLCCDLVAHWEKRNGEAVRAYDPAALDVETAERLIANYATGRLAKSVERLRSSVRVPPSAAVDLATLDEFAESGISGAEDIAEIFERQLFFGCEADDPLTSVAFRSELLPLGIKLNAFFGSDIGHWDVPDQRLVVPEAWEHVTEQRLTLADFADFTYSNVVRMLSEVNPEFFNGTTLATT
jgi:predicted TIM-barrel fold metal-dependent hydrolase